MSPTELDVPVVVRWRGGSLAFATAHDDVLRVAGSPPSDGRHSGYWSPEDLLVSAAASSFVLALASVAARRETPLLDVTARATGVTGERGDGSTGFTRLRIEATLETLAGGETAARGAVEEAEARCVAACALDVPVEIRSSVRALRSSPHRRASFR